MGSSVPFVLPQLVNSRPRSAEATILGLINFTDMPSPPHDVSIRFGSTHVSSVATPACAMRKTLVAYCKCQGLNHPRQVLTTSHKSEREYLISEPRPHPTSASSLKFNRTFQFDGIHEGPKVAKEAPLFPVERCTSLPPKDGTLTGTGTIEQSEVQEVGHRAMTR